MREIGEKVKMVKVTIECEGEQIVCEGDSVFGYTFQEKGSAYGVRGFAYGDTDEKILPERLAKAAVEQVLKIYEEDPKADQLNMLAMFTNKVNDLTKAEVSGNIVAVAEALLKVIVGGEDLEDGSAV